MGNSSSLLSAAAASPHMHDLTFDHSPITGCSQYQQDQPLHNTSATNGAIHPSHEYVSDDDTDMDATRDYSDWAPSSVKLTQLHQPETKFQPMQPTERMHLTHTSDSLEMHTKTRAFTSLTSNSTASAFLSPIELSSLNDHHPSHPCSVESDCSAKSSHLHDAVDSNYASHNRNVNDAIGEKHAAVSSKEMDEIDIKETHTLAEEIVTERTTQDESINFDQANNDTASSMLLYSLALSRSSPMPSASAVNGVKGQPLISSPSSPPPSLSSSAPTIVAVDNIDATATAHDHNTDDGVHLDTDTVEPHPKRLRLKLDVDMDAIRLSFTDTLPPGNNVKTTETYESYLYVQPVSLSSCIPPSSVDESYSSSPTSSCVAEEWNAPPIPINSTMAKTEAKIEVEAAAMEERLSQSIADVHNAECVNHADVAADDAVDASFESQIQQGEANQSSPNYQPSSFVLSPSLSSSLTTNLISHSGTKAVSYSAHLNALDPASTDSSCRELLLEANNDDECAPSMSLSSVTEHCALGGLVHSSYSEESLSHSFTPLSPPSNICANDPSAASTATDAANNSFESLFTQSRPLISFGGMTKIDRGDDPTVPPTSHSNRDTITKESFIVVHANEQVHSNRIETEDQITATPTIVTQALSHQPDNKNDDMMDIENFIDAGDDGDNDSGGFDFASLCFAPSIASSSAASLKSVVPSKIVHLADCLPTPSPRRSNSRGLKMRWRDEDNKEEEEKEKDDEQIDRTDGHGDGVASTFAHGSHHPDKQLRRSRSLADEFSYECWPTIDASTTAESSTDSFHSLATPSSHVNPRTPPCHSRSNLKPSSHPIPIDSSNLTCFPSTSHSVRISQIDIDIEPPRRSERRRTTMTLETEVAPSNMTQKAHALSAESSKPTRSTIKKLTLSHAPITFKASTISSAAKSSKPLASVPPTSITRRASVAQSAKLRNSTTPTSSKATTHPNIVSSTSRLSRLSSSSNSLHSTVKKGSLHTHHRIALTDVTNQNASKGK